MKVKRKYVGNVTILRLVGDIDEAGIDVLRTEFYDIQGHVPPLNVVVNLSAVRFISYAGIGELVGRKRKCAALRGDIKLVGMNLYAQRLFRMVGVSALFDAFETESQAMGAFNV